MVLHIALLLAALCIILLGSELFTNAVEHVGQRFGLSEGLVGSVLAAVATALPEAVVPVIAVFFSGGDRNVGEAVGTGAILGSPLMLVTLAMALIGLFSGLRRGWNVPLRPETSGLLRDLAYFTVAYSIACIALFVPAGSREVRVMGGFALLFLYIYYVYNTVLASSLLVRQGHGTQAYKPLLLAQAGVLPARLWEPLQLMTGVVMIVAGAKLFVWGVERLAGFSGLDVMAFSLLIIPVATEMPEKLNSILWVRRGKDTLAFGNVTGAMVFQGTLLPAFGMQLAAWAPSRPVLLTMGVTFAGVLWIFLLALRRRLTPFALLLNGLGYLGFFALITRA
jgi:cation:H+ antiporter